MKVLDKNEREKVRKIKLAKNIAYVIFMAIIMYGFLYVIVNNVGGYKRDESLNVKYDLKTDLIPDPIQEKIDATNFVKKVRGVNLTITKFATYDITGKVEAIQEYDTSLTGSLLGMQGTNVIDYISPIDLTLSWGEIALEENSDHITCDQYYMNTDRIVWFNYDSYLQNKYSASYILSHVSNNHIIALDQGIRNELKKVKLLDVVRMQGYLVQVRGDNGVNWGPSSQSRTDTGNHSCEIIYVEKFIKIYKNEIKLDLITKLC